MAVNESHMKWRIAWVLLPLAYDALDPREETEVNDDWTMFNMGSEL